MTVSDELLKKFKVSIGDFNNNADNELDGYYKNFLSLALSDLESDDISETQLNSELGQSATILYAEALMNKTDISANQTITLLRHKLAILTKGERDV